MSPDEPAIWTVSRWASPYVAWSLALLAPRLAPRNFVSPANQNFNWIADRNRPRWHRQSWWLPVGRAGAGPAAPGVLTGAARRLGVTSERKLSHVTAQPTEDPADPLVILRDLPEREHEEFLRQYHQAVDAAHNPAGYQQLRRLLHVWSLTAIAAGQPGYYEELAAARAGAATTVPVNDAIPDWAERAAAARDHR
jgi:hypothetical protein